MKSPLSGFLSLVLLAAACGGGDPAGSGTDSSSGTTSGTTSETTSETTSQGTSADTGTESDTEGTDPCADVQIAVVTDIDETLTTADEEYLKQLQDGTYDPLARAGGPELMTEYAARGYWVIYVTARNENVTLQGTDEPARDATERWLREHAFPLDARTMVFMADGPAFGDTAREYKAGVLTDLQAQGFSFPYAYGNATSDIGAYADAGIDPDATFIIGENAGEMGTVAVTEEDWTAHAMSHLPAVETVCEPG